MTDELGLEEYSLLGIQVTGRAFPLVQLQQHTLEERLHSRAHWWLSSNHNQRSSSMKSAKDCPNCARVRNIFGPNASYPVASLIYVFYTGYFQGSPITSFITGIEVELNQIN